MHSRIPPDLTSTQSVSLVILNKGVFNLCFCHFGVIFVLLCSILFCFRTEEEKGEAARRLEEWREEKRRNKEQEEEQRLVEEIQRKRWEKVLLLVCVRKVI